MLAHTPHCKQTHVRHYLLEVMDVASIRCQACLSSACPYIAAYLPAVLYVMKHVFLMFLRTVARPIECCKPNEFTKDECKMFFHPCSILGRLRLGRVALNTDRESDAPSTEKVPRREFVDCPHESRRYHSYVTIDLLYTCIWFRENRRPSTVGSSSRPVRALHDCAQTDDVRPTVISSRYVLTTFPTDSHS